MLYIINDKPICLYFFFDKFAREFNFAMLSDARLFLF